MQKNIERQIKNRRSNRSYKSRSGTRNLLVKFNNPKTNGFLEESKKLLQNIH